MSTGCQKDRQRDRQTARQTERQTEKQKERQKDFSAYSSKQKMFRMSTGCQKDSRKTEIQTDRRTDRFKTERLFSLVIKTKVAENVNRMSER